MNALWPLAPGCRLSCLIFIVGVVRLERLPANHVPPRQGVRHARRLVPKDILNIEGALYFCTFFQGVVNSLVVQPVFAAERTVFARERAARMYACLPYALSLVRTSSPHLLPLPELLRRVTAT